MSTNPTCTCGHDALDHTNIRDIGCTVEGCTCSTRRRDVQALADQEPPETPYAGTSGWSGSVTSEARAIREDSDGTTTQRQAEVLAYLDQRGWTGATWREVAQEAGWHHGQASGALSVLHKVGKVVRLFGDGSPNTVRNGCAVYVLPEYVAGRQPSEHGRKRPTTTEAERDAMRRLMGALPADGEPTSVAVASADLEAILDALARLQ